MSKGVVLSVDSANKLKELFRAEGDGATTSYPSTRALAVGNNRVCLLKAVAVSATVPPLWDAKIVVFEGVGTEVEVGDVLLDDATGITLTADEYYLGQEGGDDATTGLPVFQAITTGTYPLASLTVTGLVSGGGTFAEVPPQQFRGTKQFDQIIIGDYLSANNAYILNDNSLKELYIWQNGVVGGFSGNMMITLGARGIKLATTVTGGGPASPVAITIDGVSCASGTDALGNTFRAGLLTTVGTTPLPASPPAGVFTGTLP